MGTGTAVQTTTDAKPDNDRKLPDTTVGDRYETNGEGVP